MNKQQNSPKKSVDKNSKSISVKDTTQTICEQFQIIDFPHKAPEGYSYELESFKRNITSIWVRDHRKYVYNGGDPVRCIWGFFNSKTNTYYAPINSSTVGSVVNIEDTTPYSAMQLNLSPLMVAFL